MEPLARPSAGSQVTSVPKVFGTLSTIFSSLGLLIGLMTSFSVLIPWAIGGMEKSIPGEKTAEVDVMLHAFKQIYGGIGAIGLLLTIMSGLLLAIGIGQIRYKQWARPWTVYWSQAALLSVVGMIAISLMMIGPGYRDLLSAAAAKNSASAPDMGALASIFGGTFSGLFVFFYAPYPVLLLAFFTREKVRDAMIY
jgi:hypothetical protein